MPSTPEHPFIHRLRTFGARFTSFVLTHEKKILWTSIAAFVFIFSALGGFKLWFGGYNALDLAIYRQVAANSIHGHWFAMSIHPHSYLGDHVELFFAALFPFYAVAQHPLTLLILQSIAVALAAVPLVAVAGRLLPKPWPVFFGLAYLANPVVQNMVMFEFHMLPFAIPLVCLVILAYQDKHFGRFLLWSVLAMTVREDVALVIGGFGLLALFDRRHWKWVVAPILLGAAWFMGALWLAGHVSGYGHYKFLSYYGWLGRTPGEIIQTILTRPWIVIQHLLQFARLSLALALLMPFAFLPLLKKRWLIPSLPILAQIFLAGATGDVVVDTHYPSLLIPFFLLAVLEVFVALGQSTNRGVLMQLAKERMTFVALYTAIVVYCMFSLGPLIQSMPVLASTRTLSERIRLQQTITQNISSDQLLTGPEDLVNFSNRAQLYSLHYVFLGHKQFSDESYVLPDVKTVILNQHDFLTLQIIDDTTTGHHDGYARIRQILSDRGFALTTVVDRYAIFTHRQGLVTNFDRLWSTSVPSTMNGAPSTHGSLQFLGWSAPDHTLKTSNQTIPQHEAKQFTVLPFDLVFSKTKADQTIYQLELTFSQAGHQRYRVLMPFGGGLFPTSDWSLYSPVTNHFDLVVPKNIHGPFAVHIRVMDLDGRLGLNGVRSAVPIYSKYQPVGATIDLGQTQ